MLLSRLRGGSLADIVLRLDDGLLSRLRGGSQHVAGTSHHAGLLSRLRGGSPARIWRKAFMRLLTHV